MIKLQIIEMIEINQGQISVSDLWFDLQYGEVEIGRALKSLQATGIISVCGDQITRG